MNKKIMFTLMIFLVLLCSCGAISAMDEDGIPSDEIILEESSTDLSSNVEYKTFKELNDEISTKNEIELSSDYIYNSTSDNDYTEGIVVDKPVVVNGNGFKINGTDESKLFDVKSNGKLTLNNLVIISDYGSTKKIESSFKNAGTVTLNNVTFITTQTKLDEESFLSASFYNSGTMNIFNSKFVNSTVTTNRQSYLGLIYNLGTLNIEDTIFDNNKLIESSRYASTISATNLISNEKKLIMNRVTVTNNYMKTPQTILGLIRGVEYSFSEININNSFFKDNKVVADESNVQGVIIWTKAGTLNIMNSKFINTTGAKSAGVIYSLIPNVLINNTFEKNIVGDRGDGGVIYTQGVSTFINNTFKDNSAYNGGAIYCTEDLQSSTSNLFKGNVFINNKASNQGGAIYSAGNMGSKTSPIEDNVFINNEAGMGGAIFLRGSWTSKSIYATKTIFEENFASKGGSAVYNYMVTGSYITNITNSIFYNNYGNVINSGSGSSAECNYWGTNTPDFSEIIKTFTPTHIAIVTIDGAENLKYGGDYTVSFKDNATNETLHEIPDYAVDLKSNSNTITPKSIVIANGEAIVKYSAEKTGIDIIKVMKDGEELCKMNINVTDIVKTPSFNITANDINNGENLDLKFTVIYGPEGDNIYKWSLFDENNTLIETGYVENNQIKYSETYSAGNYTISIQLSNVEGWTDLEVNDTFEIKKVDAEPATHTNETQNNTNTQNQNTTETPSNTQKTSSQTQNSKTKKITPKITAKNKTFKAKLKIKKYTITLKAGKTPIKKVQVILKIKGKTYKAKTNAKGKATFKIKKMTKKGKFKAVITFKGNNNYNKVSKKVKITIKK